MSLEAIKVKATDLITTGINNTIVFAIMAVKLHGEEKDYSRLYSLIEIAKQAETGHINGQQLHDASVAAKELKLEGLI